MPEKWSHLSASPGGYVYDPETGRCPGRVNQDGTEDRRFTADGDASIMNEFFSVFSYPHEKPSEFMESVQSGYLFQGFGVILSEWDVLTGPEWAAKFTELCDLYPQSLGELLREIGNNPAAERQSKLEVATRLYGPAAKKHGWDTSGFRSWEKERKAEAKAANDEKLVERIEKQINVALGKYILGHKRINRNGQEYYLEASWPEGTTLANVDPYTALYGWRADFSPKTGLNALIFDKAFRIAWERQIGRPLKNFNRFLIAYCERLPRYQAVVRKAKRDAYVNDPVIKGEQAVLKKLLSKDFLRSKPLRSILEKFDHWCNNGKNIFYQYDRPEGWVGTWAEFIEEQKDHGEYLPPMLNTDRFLLDFEENKDEVLYYFNQLSSRLSRLEKKVADEALKLDIKEQFRLQLIEQYFHWHSSYEVVSASILDLKDSSQVFKHSIKCRLGDRIKAVPEVDRHWVETRGYSQSAMKCFSYFKENNENFCFYMSSEYFGFSRLGLLLTLADDLGIKVGKLADSFPSKVESPVAA